MNRWMKLRYPAQVICFNRRTVSHAAGRCVCTNYTANTRDSGFLPFTNIPHLRSIHGSVTLRKINGSEQEAHGHEGESSSSPSSVLDGLEANSRWRKGHLQKIEEDMKTQTETQVERPEPLEINSDDEVQQMWKDMESRVTRRRSLTIADAKMMGKKVGRSNIRKTDEEAWLRAGLYGSEDDTNEKER